MIHFDRVIPLLVYDDIVAAHDFLVQAFGFEPGGIDRNDEGKPIHAEVRAGTTSIWLHRVASEHSVGSPREVGVASSGLVVHVDDVDQHFKRAIAAGAHVDNEPTDQPYGQREYGVRDLEGHRWWFAAPVKELHSIA